MKEKIKKQEEKRKILETKQGRRKETKRERKGNKRITTYLFRTLET
jgi:hypothetical protein